MAQVAGGEVFSKHDRQQVDATIRAAEQLCRFEFSVYVGHVNGDPRSFATQLHNSLVVPSKSILIMVDPTERVLEIVTGGKVRVVLDDTVVLRTVAAMQSAFADGDVVGGINRGITHLAEAAKAGRSAAAGDPAAGAEPDLDSDNRV
ncbi:DUF5130 family protein [Nocardioides sp. CPCC 205120]|uniref:DUF5130 family protein n=1 Tax=Nocardioides sp. CPCC 205120 TaxID=3406462 RepID=UPI003B5113F4